jgi:Ser/Thr protein kinase RdoA (MazF antagonist)
MTLRHDVQALAAQFQIYGEYLCAEPFGSGHINDTYRVKYNQGGATLHYLLQRINHYVFKKPPELMENVRRVTEHIRGKIECLGDVSRRVLTIIPTRDGQMLYQDAEGNYWRTYVFIENACTFDAVETAAQAYQAAKEFGRFQKLLADLPAPRLFDTIPDFHNTPKRFAALEQAIAADSANRAASAKAEIEFALSRKPVASVLLDLNALGKIPERTTHNDTKFNNVMLDQATNEALCVIDLDTVMPGLALYDFGDMVRTTTSPALEDERDLTKVQMQMPMYEGLVQGYLSTAGEFLTQDEKSHLAFSGKLITFEQGVRFLADYLAGDAYYKIHREGHNLDRCRTQFKLVECIERQEEEMNKLAEKC